MNKDTKVSEKFNNSCTFCYEKKKTDPVACGYCREMTGNKTRHQVCDDCWKMLIRDGHPEDDGIKQTNESNN